MLTRGKVLLLTILCLLSLVSIGFASWTITESDEEIVYGSMHTDNVINSAEFIQLDTTKGKNNTGIDCFDYYEFGYIDNDGYNSNYGYITIYYVLNLKKCCEVYTENWKSIDISFKLQYANNIFINENSYNIFIGNTSSAGASSITATCNYTDENGILPKLKCTSYSEEEYPAYIVNINFENDKINYEDNIYFKIDYTLFATTGDYFKNNIYSFFYSNMIDNESDFKVDIILNAK